MCQILFCMFCCGYCKPKEATKQTKVTTKKKKSTGSAKYGTNWETKASLLRNMTPSEIEDSLITKQIAVDEKKYDNRVELYKAIGRQYGFELTQDEPIGKGGFGEVYKIKDSKKQTILALKIMKMKKTEGSIFDENRFKSFKHEIFILRQNPYKNIIQLFDHFMTKSWLSFMIMEFATGGDLKNRLRAQYDSTGQPFSENEAKCYFAQISNAMYFVHTRAVIHGDLKLENILVTIDSTGKEVIKVSDFGCARVAYKEGEGVLMRGKAEGTLICMAPEQIRVFICRNLKKPHILKREVYTYNPFRADIWSLGVCLYRMLFYEYPFPYDPTIQEDSLLKMLKLMKRSFDAPKDITEKLSPESMDLLRGLLEYDKNNRLDIQILMTHRWIDKSIYLDHKLISSTQL